ncbi:hypothetical protein DICTH_1818 [Dictyoglomus thermophilum H-6-12]|uniref:Uncharacterized protein n=1 Tax=Dictyoglomus thermophilum (strain ATCC 35947 / DSM 3960 / H-6-12) TaxID=309799 RepID=B5YBA1_DICT6|nr:hypothetical protein DICTH_1818 [Dictyoglomus thermophilum H-6-12]
MILLFIPFLFVGYFTLILFDCQRTNFCGFEISMIRCFI